MSKQQLEGYGECDQCGNEDNQDECFCCKHNEDNPIDNWEPIIIVTEEDYEPVEEEENEEEGQDAE